MWLFTIHGFYSVVRNTRSDATPSERMIIRARKREHLRNLQSNFGVKAKIFSTLKSDYQFRMFVSREEWERVSKLLSKEVNYGNFKEEANKHVQETDPVYIEALHHVWMTMFLAQREKRLTHSVKEKLETQMSVSSEE